LTGNGEHKAQCDDEELSADCPALVYAYAMTNSIGRAISWNQVCAGEAACDFTWVHLNANSTDAHAFVRSQSYIPKIAADALLAIETRPRAARIDNGFSINLRGVNHNPGAEPDDLVSLRIWVDDRHVVTARRRTVRAIQDLQDMIERPGGPATPGALVAFLVSSINTNMEPFVEETIDEIDQIEDLLLENEDRNIRRQLASARRTAVQLRRYIAPQREAIVMLAASEHPIFDADSRLVLRESANTVMRMTEEIDAARERATIFYDELTDQRAQEMTRNTLILSTVAAVFLPLQFIVGLLGANVGGIPGSEHPIAFWVVLVFCLTVAAAMLTFFRARDWL
jgi:zinc transporter